MLLPRGSRESMAPRAKTPADTTPAFPAQRASDTPASASDASRRVVAYIYGNVPVTREDLGEYLIARFGVERVDFLVNHKIVNMACQAKGIVITDGEVEA